MIRFLVIATLLFVFSCAGKEKEPTAVSAYKEAYEILQDKDYPEAAERFEKVSDDYAFSLIAPKAQMMAIYAYYKAEEYEEVQRAADDFVTVFPSDKNTDYVLYIKGMSHYDVIPQVDRSQESARSASMIFRELVARFPESKYYLDCKDKIFEIDKIVAASYMSKGRYYMNNEKYVAAMNNFQKVTKRYRHTNQICESYFRLMEVSYAVGINDWLFKYARDLKKTCQGNIWFNKGQMLIKKL